MWSSQFLFGICRSGWLHPHNAGGKDGQNAKEAGNILLAWVLDKGLTVDFAVLQSLNWAKQES